MVRVVSVLVRQQSVTCHLCFVLAGLITKKKKVHSQAESQLRTSLVLFCENMNKDKEMQNCSLHVTGHY